MYVCFMKIYLGVSNRIPNAFVHGEVRCFPLSTKASLRSVKHWLRILKMPVSIYLCKLYELLLNGETADCNWVGKLKTLFMKYGFITERQEQDVQNEWIFVSGFKERMINEFKAEWSTK